VFSLLPAHLQESSQSLLVLEVIFHRFPRGIGTAIDSPESYLRPAGLILSEKSSSDSWSCGRYLIRSFLGRRCGLPLVEFSRELVGFRSADRNHGIIGNDHCLVPVVPSIVGDDDTTTKWILAAAEEFLDAYLTAADIEDAKAPLFKSLDKGHKMTGVVISRRDMLRVVKQRCNTAGLSDSICNHTFRSTGITVFLNNGGSLEAAQDMANHSDPRTTKLYDRRKELANLSEIERRIAFE